VAPADAATETAITPTPTPAAATDCTVAIASVPAGAEIFGPDASSLGKTPAKLMLPCGVATKLVLKKARYAPLTRSITPKATGQKPIKVALARVTFLVKVSSSPAGAKITVGSKMVGVTPTTVKLPAFETSTLTLAKDGFAPEITKVTPKQNNLSVFATLKKTAGKRR
jgi:hypothetical protein